MVCVITGMSREVDGFDPLMSLADEVSVTK